MSKMPNNIKIENKYYYITVLSNWILGYDKYKNIYSKKNIINSKFPKEFYLLKENELEIGINKANLLLNKLNINDNAVIRIETLNPDNVKKNDRSGLGWVIKKDFVVVSGVSILENNVWKILAVEDLTAMAYKLNNKNLYEYVDLKPRTLSVLPIARACQAKCSFCFSESSISVEQKKEHFDYNRLEDVAKEAKRRGVERFVITGGWGAGFVKRR